MKPCIKSIAVAMMALLTAACSSTRPTASSDDIYYNPGDDKKTEIASTPVTPPTENDQKQSNIPPSNSQAPERFSNGSSQSSSEQVNGDTYVTNNYNGDYYSSDDYYDYAYAARLRRFNRNYNSWNYYDSYYTNAYWYNYDPFYYNVSIYSSYNFWGPGYYSASYFYPCNRPYGWGVTIGSGWGGGYYNYHPYNYNPWYNNHPYYSYQQGYRDGFYDGFNTGYYNNSVTPLYYNSYDVNTKYYGPRSSVSGNGNAPRSLGERYENAIASEGSGIKTTPYERSSGNNSTGRNGGINDARPADPVSNSANEKKEVSTPYNNTGAKGDGVRTSGNEVKGSSGRDQSAIQPGAGKPEIKSDNPYGRTGTSGNAATEKNVRNSPYNNGKVYENYESGGREPAKNSNGINSGRTNTDKTNQGTPSPYNQGRDNSNQGNRKDTYNNSNNPRRDESKSGNQNNNSRDNNYNNRNERGNQNNGQTHPRNASPYQREAPKEMRNQGRENNSNYSPRQNSYSSPSAHPNNNNSRPARPRN